jgi:hypothetical protein
MTLFSDAFAHGESINVIIADAAKIRIRVLNKIFLLIRITYYNGYFTNNESIIDKEKRPA